MIKNNWINIYNLLASFNFDVNILYDLASDDLIEIINYYTSEKITINIQNINAYSCNEFQTYIIMHKNNKYIIAFNNKNNLMYYFDINDITLLVHNLFDEINNEIDIPINYIDDRYISIPRSVTSYIKKVLGCQIKYTMNHNLLYLDYDDMLEIIRYDYHNNDKDSFGIHSIHKIADKLYSIYISDIDDEDIENVACILDSLLELFERLKEAQYKIFFANKILEESV